MGECVCSFFFFKKKKSGALFSGGDGLCWRGARGSPSLARKPDAWSHCLALPGKAGKASAGVIKQHAGAAGSEQAASEVPLDLSSRRESPWTANVAAFKPPKKSPWWVSLLPGEPGASSVGLARYGFKGWLWSKEQQQDEKAFSPALLPPKAFHLLSNVAERAETHSQQTAVTDGRS